MQRIDGQLVMSPRDLIAELECSHRLHLDWAVAVGKLDRPKRVVNPMLDLLAQIGRQHEEDLSEPLESGGTFVQIENESHSLESYQRSFAETQKAMSQGIDVIAQATLFSGDFVGFVDFLILSRDERNRPVKDSAGRFIYDPVDAKSARSAKEAAILQVTSYAYMLEQLGMPRPRYVYLWLAGDQEWSASTDEELGIAGESLIRTREKLNGFSDLPNPIWAPPTAGCSTCTWIEHCKSGREDAQDLSLIYDIRMKARTAFIDVGIHTMHDLAFAADHQRPQQMTPATFQKLRAQAHLQVRGLSSENILFEAINANHLSLMPEPSPGDVWFDIEGDPFAYDGEGLEYMLGVLSQSAGAPSEFVFKTFDARDREEEGRSFTDFMQWIIARRRQYPDMHIYHYAPYEKTALNKLARIHGVMEKEVSKLLAEDVLVDLYSITRKSFRFSTPSMSIKYVEQVYQGKRVKGDGVVDALGSVVEFELALSALNAGDDMEFERRLQSIREYNKVDCESTKELDMWLRDRAMELGINSWS